MKLIDFVMDTGLSFKQAKELIGPIEAARWERKEHPGKLVIPTGVKELGKSHKAYLNYRGFDPDQIAKLWGVQGIGMAARLAWRLFIPLIHKGETVSWTTRACNDEVDLRYITAKPEEERLPSKSLLYGMDYVRHSVIVVEGPTDVWRVGPGAVASFGTVFSKTQVLTLSRVNKRIICFDSEPVAQRRAKKLADLLAAFDGETLVVELDADDPGSASPKEIKSLRKLL